MEEKTILAGKATADNLIAGDRGLTDLVVSAEDIKRVDVSAHIPRLKIVLGKMNNCVKEIAQSNLAEFTEKNGNSVELTAFPVTVRKMNNLAKQLHARTKDFCIGKSDLMELSVFTDKFYPVYTDFTDRLEELKAGMRLIFDEEIADFCKNARSLIGRLDIPADASARLLSEVDKIEKTNGEGFISRIGIDLITDFGAERVSNEDLKKLLSDCRKKQEEKLIKDIFGGSLEDAFRGTVTYLNSVASATSADLSSYTGRKEKLISLAGRIRRENLGGYPVINVVADKLRELSRIDDIDEAIDLAVTICANIYGTAAGFGFDLSFPKGYPDWLTPEYLEATYNDLEASGRF